MTITSPHNAKLKEIRALHRRREREDRGRFVAEGEDLVAAAQQAGWPAVHTLVAAGSGLPGEQVEPELLGRASTLGSGSRVVGVYETRWARPAGPLCVALWGVGDPGNVGTVIRSALAFGVDTVALGPRCADPFSPKAVRASMGAIFHVPVARVSTVAELPGEIVGLAARAGEQLRGDGVHAPRTLLIGAERAGLGDDVQAACDRLAHIPIRSESLNAAMAATIALYEITRRP